MVARLGCLGFRCIQVGDEFLEIVAQPQSNQIVILLNGSRIFVAGGNGLLEPSNREIGLDAGLLRSATDLADARTTAEVTARRRQAVYRLSASLRLSPSHISADCRQPSGLTVF